MRVSTDWMSDANCVGVDPEAFFPADGQRVSAAVYKICAECTVRTDCLEYAVNDSRHTWGVWGGMSARDRMKLRSARGIRTVPEEAPCGTEAAHRRHQRRREWCPLCQRAALIQRQIRDEQRRRSG